MAEVRHVTIHQLRHLAVEDPGLGHRDLLCRRQPVWVLYSWPQGGLERALAIRLGLWPYVGTAHVEGNTWVVECEWLQLVPLLLNWRFR